jgi:TRAP-type C4-dicarboxylate transport system permease small subunit
MAPLGRLFDRLIDFQALLACIMICALTGSVALDVIIRALNVGSMPWALEGSEYMLYGVTFFGAPWVLRAGAHVSVDVFVQHMPRPIARLLDIAADLAGIVVSLFLVYYGVKVTATSMQEHVIIYRTLVFPEWWILWVMPFTALCLVGEFIRRLGRRLSGQAPLPAGGH